jgi:hypothetical protein
MRENGATDRHVLKNVAAGLIGGAVGTFAMSEFQDWWTRAARGRQSRSAGGKHDARDWQELSEDQNANELVAQTVAETTMGRSLTDRELSVAAPAVHYSFGTAIGGLYGALAGRSVAARSLAGATFGAAVWGIADEIAMPALGLSERTDVQSAERHLHSFASHIVFGVTTELVRRGVLRVWPGA